MASGGFKIKNSTNLQAQAGSVVNTTADMAYNSATSMVEIYTSAVESITTNSNVQTLTNKTISGGSITGVIGITNGGTGQTTAAAAITALAGVQTSGEYLRSDGTNTSLSTIQVADVPTLNQNTSGNAATVTTNANMTGPITGTGNVTSITSQTGTGTTFVMSVSPSLTTPNLGTPSAGVLTNATGTASGLTAGTATNIASGANGSIPYQTGSGATTMLAVSSNGDILTLSGGVPTWVVPATSAVRTINSQSGTTYTFILSDGSNAGTNALVTFGSGSATTVTVPTNASVAFPVGSQIDCIQLGAGTVTFSAAGGVTLNSQGGLLAVAAQYVGVTLLKTGTNTWVLMGNL